MSTFEEKLAKSGIPRATMTLVDMHGMLACTCLALSPASQDGRPNENHLGRDEPVLHGFE